MKNYILIPTILVMAVCAYASGQSKPTASTDNLVLLGRPNPALCGIDRVYIVIEGPDRSRLDKDRRWQSLRSEVLGEIQGAGIKTLPPVSPGTAARPEIPEFHIQIQTTEPNDSQQSILFVRSFLTRQVYFSEDRSVTIKAEVWQTEAVLQFVPTDRCLAEISKIALRDAKAFAHSVITARRKKVSANTFASEPNDREAAKSQRTQIPTGAFVASKNSRVFHKPDCTFAEFILPDNLVTYKTRDDAIKAGKRPCKRCKP